MFQRKNPSQLQAQLEQMTSTGSFNQADAREWSLTTDKAGNGQALIRFLPAKDDNSTPFVKIYNHGFKVGSRWFIENCPTTNQSCECPVCQANSELWNSGVESDKDIAKNRKRKLSYWANILVIKDPSNDENNGKVFKYRFGQKIMDKIQAMINVDVDMGEKPVDVTCVFEGCNFLLKTKKVSNFANYDEAKFQSQGEIDRINDPAFQSFLMENMNDLNEIVAADKFKTTEELQAKFNQVVGGGSRQAPAAQDDFDAQLQAFESGAGAATTAAVATATVATVATQQAQQTFVNDAPSVDMDDLDSLLADL